MNKKYKNSLCLMKAYPLHLGHLHLINTAIENSDVVHVILCHNKTQSIPGHIRYNALTEIYKNNKNVITHFVDDSGLPQHDTECETLDEFYSYWVPFVHKYVTDLDSVFTSEEYGDDFARYLGIEHFLVDKERNKFQTSGTKIRSNPFENWEFIPTEIRPFFVKRIAIMGPESAGKSTLSENLAKHFNTNFVPEYGRTVYENNGNRVDISDFIPISIGRQELEDELIKHSNKLLFCDTEDIATYLFSKMFCPLEYKQTEDWFLETIRDKKKYDLYLLMKPDCDGIQDGTRCFLNERLEHYNVIKDELIKYECNFIEVGGSFEERTVTSIKIISELLK